MPPSVLPEKHFPAGRGLHGVVLLRHLLVSPRRPALLLHAHRGREQAPRGRLQRRLHVGLVLEGDDGAVLPHHHRRRDLRQGAHRVRILYASLQLHVDALSIESKCLFISSLLSPTRKTNAAQNGVWVYEIGSWPFFVAITAGMVTSLPEEEQDATTPPWEEEEEDFLTEAPTEAPTEYQPSYPGSETVTPGYTEPTTEDYEFEPDYPESETVTPTYSDPERAQPTEPRYPDPSEPRYPDPSEPRYPDPSEPRYPDPSEPRYPDPSEPRYPDPSEPRYPDRTETRDPASEPLQPRHTVPEPNEPRHTPVEPRYPGPVQPVPPHSRPQQPQIVVIDEAEDLDMTGKKL